MVRCLAFAIAAPYCVRPGGSAGDAAKGIPGNADARRAADQRGARSTLARRRFARRAVASDRREDRAGVCLVDLLSTLREELSVHKAETRFGDPKDFVFPTENGRRQDRNNARRHVVVKSIERASENLTRQGLNPLPEGTDWALLGTGGDIELSEPCEQLSLDAVESRSIAGDSDDGRGWFRTSDLSAGKLVQCRRGVPALGVLVPNGLLLLPPCLMAIAGTALWRSTLSV